MTTRSRNLKVNHVVSEPARILSNSRAAYTDGTSISKANFAAQLSRARRVDVSWRDNQDVPPEQAVDHHVENEPHKNGIEEGEPVSENESCMEAG